MPRPMGDNQIGVLRALYERPYPGGWCWDNHSTTVRILNSLVRRGYAETFEAQGRYQNKPITHYRITANGKAAYEMTKTYRRAKKG